VISRYLFAVIAILAVLVAACSSPPPGPTPDSRYADAHDAAPLKPVSPDDVADATPRPDPILEDYHNYRERGIASWYGANFNGHATSNGEIYDLYQASAAHKTLPIPSYARVTNLDNGKSVVVRVNDRGPFHSERLIDLSYGAAVKLGYMESGTARVEVEVLNIAGVDDRRDATSGSYRYLQLGAFGSEDSAQRLQGELQSLLSAPVFISQVDSGGNMLYRVRVGPVASNDELLVVQQQLQQGGYDAGQPLP